MWRQRESGGRKVSSYQGKGGSCSLSTIGPKGPCSTNFSELSRPIIVPDKPLC